MLRIVAIAAIWMAFCFDPAAAGDMQAPRIIRAAVDWDAATAALDDIAPLRALHASADTAARGPDTGSAIGRLDAATADVLPGIARSAVPVLVPFDAAAYLRDRAASATDADPDRAYFFGFGHAPFFDAGPAGYDAAFRFTPARIPDLADIRFANAATIVISGSLLTYRLEPPVSDLGVAVPALETDFPGIRRIMLETYVRYTFVRFGVPYMVSLDCFDGRVARARHMACRDADRVVEHFLKSLRVAGGAPQAAAATTATTSAPSAPRVIARPAESSPTFTYYGPGRLPAGTVRGTAGRTDYTVYADLRFPIAQAPAFANTQYFKRRIAGRMLAYPWRDNFCERRGFYVGQCPGGRGHQGQDIRAGCNPRGDGDDRCTAHQMDVVAAHDGMILRAPSQEAVYLFINTPDAHLRVRYLHMRPKLLDADGILSGLKVTAGETIGQIGNYSQHENGTSYHLHFDVQVPTSAGWVFVSPYMTLVAAYEHLIGGRGEEITEDMIASAATNLDAATTRNDAVAARALTLAAVRHAILAPAADPPALPAAAGPAAPSETVPPPAPQPAPVVAALAAPDARAHVGLAHVGLAATWCGEHPGRYRRWHGCDGIAAWFHGSQHGVRRGRVARSALFYRFHRHRRS